MVRAAVLVVMLGVAWPVLEAPAGERSIPEWGVTVDPDGDCDFKCEDDRLSITAPGPVHDLSAELQRMNAPRVVQRVHGDFVAVVRVLGQFQPGDATIPVRTAYNGAGLLIMASEKTYVRLERATLLRAGRSQHYGNFELRRDGRVERIGIPTDFKIDPEKVTYLRVERRGNQILGAVTQEPGKWFQLEPKTVELPERLQVGVAAVNASTRPFTAQFECLSIVQPENSRDD